MPKLPVTVATRIATARAIQHSSPALAARAVLPVFMRTRPVRPVHPEERRIHDEARRSTLVVRGREIVAYEWGGGTRVALLVHGWRGRASQFAPLVRELKSEGFRVLAFDAPAHGGSAGRRTDIRDWIAAIAALQLRHGRFDLIVGHSLGACAALTAVHEGTAAGGVAAIASFGDGRYTTDAFARAIGLGPAATRELGSAFTRLVLQELETDAAWRRLDRVGQPLPPSVPLLLVHDVDDREVASTESERLLAAHGERARLVRVSGSGHTRVLGHDTTLDVVTVFATSGLAGVDAALAAA